MTSEAEVGVGERTEIAKERSAPPPVDGVPDEKSSDES